MYHMGGMYLDIDVECYRPADPLLVGWDLVLQSEYSEGQDISNAILASAPGLPYWEALIEATAAAADAIPNKRRLDAMDVLHATGPPVYTQIFKQVCSCNSQVLAFSTAIVCENRLIELAVFYARIWEYQKLPSCCTSNAYLNLDQLPLQSSA